MGDDEAGDPCGQAWAAVSSRDFRAWGGLPEGCGYERLDAVFPRRTPEHGAGTLGRAHRPAAFRMHAAGNEPHDARVWFRDGRVALVELWYPPLPHPPGELLQALGEPEARLDYQLDVMPVAGGAWVYPARGITVFLDAPHTRVMRIDLFHPCTLAAYLEDTHVDARVRERPVGGLD